MSCRNDQADIDNIVMQNDADLLEVWNELISPNTINGEVSFCVKCNPKKQKSKCDLDDKCISTVLKGTLYICMLCGSEVHSLCIPTHRKEKCPPIAHSNLDDIPNDVKKKWLEENFFTAQYPAVIKNIARRSVSYNRSSSSFSSSSSSS